MHVPKSISDVVVSLNSNAGAMIGVVNSILGCSSFFKNLPKYLLQLPAEFQNYVPSYLTKDLPNFCDTKVDVLLNPVKDFLSYINFFTTLQTVTAPDFYSKSSWSKIGNNASKLISSGIDAFLLIPTKLQWFDMAGYLSNTAGAFSPYLKIALSLDSFTIVGKVASIAASFFDIITLAKDIEESKNKIKDCKDKIAILTKATPTHPTERQIKDIAKNYCLNKNKKEVLADAYAKVIKLNEEIVDLEYHLEALNFKGEKKAIEKLTKEKEIKETILEDTKEEIRRLYYLWNQYGKDKLVEEVKKIDNELIYQQVIARTPEVENLQQTTKAALKNLTNLDYKISDISQGFDKIFNEASDFEKPTLRAILEKAKAKIQSHAKVFDTIGPVNLDKKLNKKVVRHIINYEISQNNIDIQTKESSVVRSYVLIALNVASIAMSALLIIKPAAAIMGVALGFTLSTGTLAIISATLFGVGLVLTIVGITRCIHSLYWLKPEDQGKAHTHIGRMIFTPA